MAGVGIVLEDLSVELTGEPPDGFLIPDIGGAEPTRRQAAEELRRLNEDNRTALAGRLDGRGDAARGAAVDDDILGGQGDNREEGKQQGAHGVIPVLGASTDGGKRREAGL